MSVNGRRHCDHKRHLALLQAMLEGDKDKGIEPTLCLISRETNARKIPQVKCPLCLAPLRPRKKGKRKDTGLQPDYAFAKPKAKDNLDDILQYREQDIMGKQLGYECGVGYEDAQHMTVMLIPKRGRRTPTPRSRTKRTCSNTFNRCSSATTGIFTGNGQRSTSGRLSTSPWARSTSWTDGRRGTSQATTRNGQHRQSSGSCCL